jgi:hypothetical protein
MTYPWCASAMSAARAVRRATSRICSSVLGSCSPKTAMPSISR